MTSDDERFMWQALKEAQVAGRKEEIPIGAVVVSKGIVIGRGHNLTERLHDVTAHAEMQAITAAAEYLGSKYLTDCTLYVTVEPCLMCAGAIAWAQLGRVVYGASDPKRGFSTQVARNPFHPRTQVCAGVLAEECGALMSNFFLNKRN